MQPFKCDLRFPHWLSCMYVWSKSRTLFSFIRVLTSKESVVGTPDNSVKLGIFLLTPPILFCKLTHWKFNVKGERVNLNSMKNILTGMEFNLGTA